MLASRARGVCRFNNIVPKQWHRLVVAIFGHEDGHVVLERIVRSSFFFLQRRISDGYDTLACVCASPSGFVPAESKVDRV
jgi:hypothetical protein